MRTYFDFNLKGKRLFPYMFAGWVLMLGVGALSYYWQKTHSEPVFFDAALWKSIGFSMAVNFLSSMVSMFLLFFIVSYTIKGLSYREAGFVCEHDFKEYFWIVLKGSLLTMVTFGIYYPWFLTRVIRYFASNTFFRFNEFRFEGSPMSLFGLIVIFAVLPMIGLGIAVSVMVASTVMGLEPALWTYLVVLAVLFLMAMFLSLYVRWFIDFSYGPKRITADVGLWHSAWFMFGQVILLVLTSGFYGPMFILRVWRYYIGRTVLGEETVEDKFGFSLLPWRDYFYLLWQGFLTVITLGIYGAWAYANIAGRIFRRTYVDVVEEQKIPMPAAE